MGTHSLHTRLPIRLITLNIRYANPTPVPGESPWAIRRPKLCAQLRFATAGGPHHPSTAFICLQEALAAQVADIQAALNNAHPPPPPPPHPTPTTASWQYIGVGRDDGHAAGEFSPVFYNADAWTCVRHTTYWLSETPEKAGSRGWDAALPRIVTMGEFVARGQGAGARVVVLSTHFDHQGVRAREESAKLILRLAEDWAGRSSRLRGGLPSQVGRGVEEGEEEERKGRPPVFLGGDFNSSPSDKAYQTMTAPKTGMTDISTLIPEDQRYGNELTYSSFGEEDEEPQRIDFLFVKDTTDITFHTFGVLANRFDDGVYLSDHRATIADVDIPIKGQAPWH